MGKSSLSLLIILFVLTGPICYSQTSVKVSDPRIEMQGNTIHITYDILNSTSSKEFTVELVVKDENGNVINAAALTGDIGDLVTGGRGKQIAWDLEADRIEINADIFVKLYVKAVPPPEPAIVPVVKVEEERLSDMEDPDEELMVAEEESQKSADSDTSVKPPASGSLETRYNRTGLIFQSVVFPGLGLSKYKGGPHWIRGILGYGCIAGSVIMNQVAVNTFDGIIHEAGFEAKDVVYKKSIQQDQISEVLAYTAIAIWVSDLVWTMVGTSNLKQTASFSKGIGINSTIDPVSNTPLIAFTYRF